MNENGRKEVRYEGHDKDIAIAQQYLLETINKLEQALTGQSSEDQHRELVDLRKTLNSIQRFSDLEKGLEHLELLLKQVPNTEKLDQIIADFDRTKNAIQDRLNK